MDGMLYFCVSFFDLRSFVHYPFCFVGPFDLLFFLVDYNFFFHFVCFIASMIILGMVDFFMRSWYVMGSISFLSMSKAFIPSF